MQDENTPADSDDTSEQTKATTTDELPEIDTPPKTSDKPKKSPASKSKPAKSSSTKAQATKAKSAPSKAKKPVDPEQETQNPVGVDELSVDSVQSPLIDSETPSEQEQVASSQQAGGSQADEPQAEIVKQPAPVAQETDHSDIDHAETSQPEISKPAPDPGASEIQGVSETQGEVDDNVTAVSNKQDIDTKAPTSEPKIVELTEPQANTQLEVEAEASIEAVVEQAAPLPTSFDEYNLHPHLKQSIADLGFTAPTAIQAQSLPHALLGADVVGQAQTGTGKTAAFLISGLQHMHTHEYEAERFNGEPRMLILAPTRELVMQISSDAEGLTSHSDFKTLTLIGGVDYEKQRSILREEIIDILVATPGRLIDFLRSRDVILREVEVLVLDEADRMLDMGFINDVRRIVHATPHKPFRQTLFFSATFTEETTRLAQSWTLYPHEVRIEPKQMTAESVEQVTYLVTEEDKLKLLYNLLLSEAWTKVIIFTNRRDQTRLLHEVLEKLGLSVALMSGEIDQKKRIKTIERFKSGEISVLVATDVAGRGLHVDDVSQVVNYALPESPDDYVHRIGRTGRAGQSGTSVSFATEEEAFMIPDIETHLGVSLRCQHPPEALLAPLPAELELPTRASRPRNSGQGQRRGRPQGRGRRSSR